MFVKTTKISQKIKNKSLLSIENNIIEWEKKLYYSYKKLLFKKNNKEYKYVLKTQFWSYKFTLESWFKWKKVEHYKLKKCIKKIKSIYKNGQKNITFDYYTVIEEYEFHQYKSPISINDIDINKIVVSNKFPFGKQDFKYFTSFKHDKKIGTLCIFFPNMSAYRIDFDETEYMSFLMKDEVFLEKYNEIWGKVSSIIKKEFNSETVHNKNYLKTKKNLITKTSTQKKALNVFIYQWYWLLQFIQKKKTIIPKYF